MRGVCWAKRERVRGPAVVWRRTVAVGGGSVVYWVDIVGCVTSSGESRWMRRWWEVRWHYRIVFLVAANW